VVVLFEPAQVTIEPVEVPSPCIKFVPVTVIVNPDEPTKDEVLERLVRVGVVTLPTVRAKVIEVDPCVFVTVILMNKCL